MDELPTPAQGNLDACLVVCPPGPDAVERTIAAVAALGRGMHLVIVDAATPRKIREVILDDSGNVVRDSAGEDGGSSDVSDILDGIAALPNYFGRDGNESRTIMVVNGGTDRRIPDPVLLFDDIGIPGGRRLLEKAIRLLPSKEQTRVVDTDAPDRPGWHSPYGPATRRRR